MLRFEIAPRGLDHFRRKRQVTHFDRGIQVRPFQNFGWNGGTGDHKCCQKYHTQLHVSFFSISQVNMTLKTTKESPQVRKINATAALQNYINTRQSKTINSFLKNCAKSLSYVNITQKRQKIGKQINIAKIHLSKTNDEQGT